MATPSEQPMSAARSRADGVHHGAYVVHACLERRRADDAVGHAGAALVEEDQPREGGEAARGSARMPGTSQPSSTCETQRGTKTRSNGPSPMTW